jgi:choline dehydrogenase-like flavoprotein
MLSDARAAPHGTVFRADVAIVGAGPAGIVLALALRDRGVSVLLLESGGFETDLDTSQLNEGTVVGDRLIFSGVPFDLTTVRQRGFGGTTSVWGGVCRPLDPIDFEARPELGLPGWPLDFEALAPYYERASPLCNVLNEWDPDFWLGAVPETVDLRSERLDIAMFQLTLPRKLFGRDHRDELIDAVDVEVCLWANAVRLNVEPSSDIVTSVEVATTTGRTHRAEATFFVLAAGGIEVPRLLLASNDVRAAGVGNENDLVGRFFMDHVVYNGGRVILNAGAGSTRLYSELEVHEIAATASASDSDVRHAIPFASMVPRADLRRSEKLRGCAALLISPPDFDSSQLLAHDAIAAHNVAALVRPVKTGPGAIHSMIIEAESRPDSENRVVLGTGRDALGIPNVELRWTASADDRNNIRRSLEVLAVELGRTGMGRMQIERNGVDLDDAQLWIGAHHMGTTRMHADPAYGVVDSNGRVHSTENVFIASSAVFPTSGFANPTLTIVALALRLSDHLAELVRR